MIIATREREREQWERELYVTYLLLTFTPLQEALPLAKTLLADRGYDADWFRNALIAEGIAPCIPSKTNRNIPIPHDGLLYR